MVNRERKKDMKEKLSAEEKKREKNKRRLSETDTKAEDKIEKMISKIHNSEEHKNLYVKRISDNQEKLEVLYKFSKFIKKMYTSSTIEKILGSDEVALNEFQKFQSTLVEIIQYT